MRRFKPFDISAHLDNDEVIAEFLTAVLEYPDPDAFLSAVGTVAKAHGLSSIAASAPRAREPLQGARTWGHAAV